MKQDYMREVRFGRVQTTLLCGALIMVLLVVTSCSPEVPRAAYVPVEQLVPTYGRLVSVANSPTPNQNGTGDLMGLFRDD